MLISAFFLDAFFSSFDFLKFFDKHITDRLRGNTQMSRVSSSGYLYRHWSYSSLLISPPFSLAGCSCPCVEHFEHGGIGGIVGLVKTQADFPVNLSDFQSIHIFQRKKRVHKPDIGINIRHSEGMGTYIKDICHFFYKVLLRRSGF